MYEHDGHLRQIWFSICQQTQHVGGLSASKVAQRIRIQIYRSIGQDFVS